jgi:DNA-directed RNA polymerase specialized sigma24 family protein
MSAAVPGGFDRLLQRLGEDGVDPAQAYEGLRQRLLALFRVYLPAESEALADVVLDRLAKRVSDGVVIDDVRSYSLGIARLVLQEGRLRLNRQRDAESDPTLQPDPDASAEQEDNERALRGLRACLGTLDDASRALILAYYGADGGARIRLRQQLAGQLGSSLNALRNRALRLRDRIETCLRLRLGERRPP